MTIAYFDCFAGIAGDMTLGALLDCGVPLDKLRAGLASLPVQGWQIDAEAVLRGGIHALNVSISLHGQTDEDELRHAQEHAPSHANHSHAHGEHAHAEHSHAEHAHGDSREHHANTAHEHSHSHGSHSHEGDSHEGDSRPGAHSHNGYKHSANDEHSHGAAHEYLGDGEGSDGHEHSHAHPHVHGRSMSEIREIIEASALSERVKRDSLAIFWSIAKVEAKMHHSTPDEIHFHEIGGVDSLLDICGAAWCLEFLGVDEVHCSALPMSTGYVDCAHGRMPVPAPATMELLKGVPLFATPIRGEMITPTGAGIVATLGKSFGSPPAMTPRHIGFGAGKKQFADRPNLLRVVIADKIESIVTESMVNVQAPSPRMSTHGAGEEATAKENEGLEWRTLSLVETNIDDMNPELFDHVFARLFAVGAVDVWLCPAQMKKNRPASTLSVLCAPDARASVVATILSETTTLGVRVSQVRRGALQRESLSVSTVWGDVRVKAVAWPQENLQRAAPEYDDVSRLASEHKVPAREVYAAALAACEAAKE